MPVDKLAIAGVNGGTDYLATAREQSQHIDQGIIAAAKPRPDQIAPVAMFVQGFDGLGQRDGLVGGDRGALFRLIQAGAPGRVGGQCRHIKGRNGKQAEQNGGRKESGDRHKWGDNGAPVNAG